MIWINAASKPIPNPANLTKHILIYFVNKVRIVKKSKKLTPDKIDLISGIPEP